LLQFPAFLQYRNSKVIAMNSAIDSSFHFLAIEIGGTKLQLCAGTGTGRILDRRRFAVDRERGAEGIRAQIRATLPELIERWKPTAVGVGYGGPVHWKTGRIGKSYHITGWSDFPLGEWLSEISGLPAFVDNDANVAALGEARCGAGVGRNPAFYVTLGSGVGGGLIVNDAIYHGAPPGEMEIGHLRLGNPNRIVEDDCSGWSLDKIVLAKMNGDARSLADALNENNAIAQAILAAYVDHLAAALGCAVQLLHPEIIILGGGVSLIGEPLRGEVAAVLPKYIMDVYHPGPPIALTALKEDAVPCGALILAADRMKG
jgi:glucokinase